MKKARESRQIRQLQLLDDRCLAAVTGGTSVGQPPPLPSIDPSDRDAAEQEETYLDLVRGG